MTTLEDVAIVKLGNFFSTQQDQAGGAAGNSPAVGIGIGATFTKKIIVTRVRASCAVACPFTLWTERGAANAAFTTTALVSRNNRLSSSATAPTAVRINIAHYGQAQIVNGLDFARRLSTPAGEQFEWEGFFVMGAANTRIFAVAEGIGTSTMQATVDWYEET